MIRGARVLIGTLLGAFSSAAVFGQESGIYLGGALGQAKFKEWCDTSGAPAGFVLLACEDTDTAWKLFGGYRFNRYVAIEATYVNWGKATATVGGPRDVSAEQTGMGIAGVGSLELGPQFSVFGKAGFLMSEQKTPASSTKERDETELHYGLGVKYHFTAHWAAHAEWERAEKLEVEMLSIGAEFKF